jgi:hypothetical protein
MQVHHIVIIHIETFATNLKKTLDLEEIQVLQSLSKHLEFQENLKSKNESSKSDGMTSFNFHTFLNLCRILFISSHLCCALALC